MLEGRFVTFKRDKFSCFISRIVEYRSHLIPQLWLQPYIVCISILIWRLASLSLFVCITLLLDIILNRIWIYFLSDLLWVSMSRSSGFSFLIKSAAIYVRTIGSSTVSLNRSVQKRDIIWHLNCQALSFYRLGLPYALCKVLRHMCKEPAICVNQQFQWKQCQFLEFFCESFLPFLFTVEI